MIYIVGGAGFVGSAYARFCARRGLAHTVITRENTTALAGTSCDLLFNANGNSRKGLADSEPLREFDMSVRSVAETLANFKAKTYVFLSSGDVYPDPSHPETSLESQAPDLSQMSRYGLHKFLAERLVMGSHPDWLVMRMGGFVGPGIRKNAVYDILRSDKVWLSPDAQLQFIHTDHAAELVMGLVEKGVRREVVNLGAEGLVRLGDLHRDTGSRSPFDPAGRLVRYELSLEKLAKLVGTALPQSRAEVAAFASAWPESSIA
jgi:nucleoside-diphosphate-sugar epimerase